MSGLHARARTLVAAFAVTSLAACNLILGLDGYQSASLDGGSDATSDVASDAQEISDGGCSVSQGRSVGCTSDKPVCSHGVCTAIQSLGKGSSSDHACAVLTDGHIRCWGANESGELGDGTHNAPRFPVEVQGISNAVQVATGNEFTCALLADGTARCWGYGVDGEIANGTMSSDTPLGVPIDAGTVTAISAGYDGACAIVDGGVYCWGSGYLGGLGCPLPNQPGVNYLTPTALNPPLPWPAQFLAIGSDISCFASTNDGYVTCYGDNIQGMGDGRYIAGSQCITSLDSGVVTKIGNNDLAISGTTELYAASTFVCALGVRNFCWGDNTFGEVAPGDTDKQIVTATLIPEVMKLTATQHITTGERHACAIVALQAPPTVVQCWGASDTFQLGPGTGPYPQIVPNITAVSDIAAHDDFTCALLLNGQVYCWGSGGTYMGGVQSYSLANGGDAGAQATPTLVVW